MGAPISVVSACDLIGYTIHWPYPKDGPDCEILAFNYLVFSLLNEDLMYIIFKTLFAIHQ